MIEAIAIGVFVFVAVLVAGNRALDTLAAHRAKEEAERRARIAGRAKRVDYTGPVVNMHGREIN